MPEEFEIPDFFKPNPKQQHDMDKLSDFLKNSWGILFIGFIALSIVSGAVVRVGAGERAVVFNIVTGVEKRVLGEGINFVIPVLQKATIYDVKEATYNFAGEDQSARGEGKAVSNEIHSLTADGQRVDVELTIRVRPVASELWKLHKYIGPAYASKIVFPITRTVLRETLSTYPVEDVYSVKRQEIQNKIQSRLTNDLLEKYYVQVEEVLIRNVKFSKEFQDAIDRKQQAYQEYLKMEYILEGERSKRDAKILEAEGEAKAIGLRVQALRAHPEFLNYRRAQVFGKKAKLVLSDEL